MTRVRRAFAWLLVGITLTLLLIASLPFMILAMPVLLLVGVIFILKPDETEHEPVDTALQPMPPPDLLYLGRCMHTLDG